MVGWLRAHEERAWTVGALGLGLLAWEAAVRLGVSRSTFLPAPSAILRAVGPFYASGDTG